MTRRLLSFPPFSHDSVRVYVTPTGVVHIEGTLVLRDPGERLGPCFREIHDAAVHERRRELLVDVTRLIHVNSSSLLVFLDWARWIASEEKELRYVLNFITRPGFGWQQLALPTMQRICVGYIKVSVQTPSAPES